MRFMHKMLFRLSIQYRYNIYFKQNSIVAKHLTERLHCSLGYAIAAISKIRSILLNDRLFSQFCEQNDEKFNRLLIYTEVRWLLKVVFCDLFETILEFFDNKEPSLRDSLEKFKSDIAYRDGTENLFQNPTLSFI
ncbi:hypothetical protein T06_6457, partial [Trichinella sp. T6]